MIDSNRVRKAIATASKYGLKSLYYITAKDKENTSDTVAPDEGCGDACKI